jgi:hypothetical protein
MAKSFSQSHDAYNRGDHAAAKGFSNAGKAHQRKMEQVNKEASDWIFRGQSVLSQSLYQSQLGPYLFTPPGAYMSLNFGV